MAYTPIRAPLRENGAVLYVTTACWLVFNYSYAPSRPLLAKEYQTALQVSLKRKRPNKAQPAENSNDSFLRSHFLQQFVLWSLESGRFDFSFCIIIPRCIFVHELYARVNGGCGTLLKPQSHVTDINYNYPALRFIRYWKKSSHGNGRRGGSRLCVKRPGKYWRQTENFSTVTSCAILEKNSHFACPRYAKTRFFMIRHLTDRFVEALMSRGAMTEPCGYACQGCKCHW